MKLKNRIVVKNLLLLSGLLLFCCYGCKTKKTISTGGIYDRQVQDTIYLKSGIYQLDEQLIIKSGTFLKGKNTTILFDSSDKLSVVKFDNVKNCGMSNIKFKGTALKNNKTKSQLELYNYKYVVELNKSNKIKIEDCVFENSYGTVIKINDSNELNINNVEINKVGFPTNSKISYSYDGIFIGGYTGCKNITINNCLFKDIGSTFPSGNLPWPNDGDGIQIQSKANVENIVISENTFQGCSARGVKIQSGKNIIVRNSNFIDCRSAVVLAMAYDASDVKITNNILTNSLIPFGTAGSKTIDGLTISNNKIDFCEHFFRTSGRSDVINAIISNNKIGTIDTYFLNGRFENTKIINNTIKEYASIDDKSFNFCMHIAPECKNVTIMDNYFGKKNKNSRELILKSDNRINVSKNVFEIRKN